MQFMSTGEVPKNRKIPNEIFLEERVKVLSGWPTGQEVDLEEAVRYHQRIPKHKVFVNVLREAKKTRRILLVPRTGLGTVDQQIKLLKGLEGYMDGAGIHPDSFGRWHQFDKVDKIIKLMEQSDKNLLNGYPIVNYGVPNYRKIVESVNVPIRTGIACPDPRLLTEIALAGGSTICFGYLFPPVFSFPSNKISFEGCLAYGQYLYRLVGWYCEHDVELVLSTNGANPSVPMLPSSAIAQLLVEVLAAAEQGVKYIETGYSLMCSLQQDVAALRLIPKICRKYLDRFGFHHVELFTHSGSWHGPFPKDPSSALGLICYVAMSAALAGTNKIITKTPAEAGTTPDIDDHLPALKASRFVLDLLGEISLEDNSIAQEASMIEKEVECLFNNILELGEGDVILGNYRAYQNGSMEWPFSYSKHTAGKVYLARDKVGAVRIVEPGGLPFNEEILDYHQKKMNETKDGKEISNFELMIKSVFTLGAKGTYVEAKDGLNRKTTQDHVRPVTFNGDVTVVLGVLNDIHRIGIDILDKYLRRQGVRTVSVGTMAGQDDFIGAAKEAAPDAIFISTSNGMGEVDCRGFRASCIEAGLGEIIIYVGGSVSVNMNKEQWEDIEKRYLALGIDRVFPPLADLETILNYLAMDLQRRNVKSAIGLGALGKL